LSQLRFWAADDVNKHDDDFSEPGGDDDVYDEEGGGGNRNLRLLDQPDDDAGDYRMDGSALDIAVFNLVRHSLVDSSYSLESQNVMYCTARNVMYSQYIIFRFLLPTIAGVVCQVSFGMRLGGFGSGSSQRRRGIEILLQ
jgi:hypothetical protein